MKKITLLTTLIIFTFSWSGSSQTCTHTFFGDGDDDDPLVVTVNASAITCNGANNIASIMFNPTDYLEGEGCDEWFDFTLTVDGNNVATGCASELSNIDVTGFSTLSVTSNDLDSQSDFVEIEFDLEINYTLGAEDFQLTNKDLVLTNVDANTIGVKMTSGDVITSFKAYNVLGKLVIDTKPNQSIFSVNTIINKDIVLFVKVTLDNGQVLSKKFIK